MQLPMARSTTTTTRTTATRPGSWAEAGCAALVFEKDSFWGGVYVTDPVVATFLDPKVTPWDQKCVTVEKLAV